MTKHTLTINMTPEEIADVNDALVENGYDIAIGVDGQTVDCGHTATTIFLPDGCAVANIWKFATSRILPGHTGNPITQPHHGH